MLLGRGGCQIKNKILHQRTYSQMARRYNRQGKEGLGRSSPSTSRPKNIPFRWKASPTRNGPPGWSTRLRVMEWAQGGGLVDRNFLTIELIGAGEGNIDSQWNIDYEFPDQSFNCLPLQLNKRNGKNSPRRFEKLKAEYPEATVELWAMDEHPLGLKPIFRQVWTPAGVRPTVELDWRFQ